MELRHGGILLTILGTLVLAFSVKVIPGYDEKIEELKKLHEETEENGLIWPSETYIKKWWFWCGLFLIAVGSLLQW